ncbi:DUF2283 domain-containing protein [Streptomyces sp. RKAG293]|uniref:DUF2283 domain-containing protein n=1 Tax=Streptomyces sp. RKAG293 TaxID=2893403 RepID=UPI00203466C6|nr:DUF2283 domain-containing protein [Streptomyces sp. RKAG293]MCM2417700.1 DUF2283 domain-containing protein [Streptomyces sp. RKAG293]
MADARIAYDQKANVAYVYFADPQANPKAARMYPCDPSEVEGVINLDFYENGCLIGIEVLAASSKLPQYMQRQWCCAWPCGAGR